MARNEIITFGCRLNAYESEVMRAHCEAAGLEDAVIVNTCAVTGEAVRQASQAIRRARRERPDARIIVTGCAAQIEPERFAAMGEIDHVIGNSEKLAPETFVGLEAGSTERVQVNDIGSVRETASHLIEGFGNRARAYVQIQNGCDHRCTFCVIPFGRGPSRSVPAGEVVVQVEHLVERGYREVVLTGVDITAYGADLPGAMTLGKLVKKLLKLVPDLDRLRLSSIDSVEADPDLLDAIASQERLMPHLHLSLQAGDDLTLKRMKRRHNRADAIGFCDAVRRARPDVAFGADLIAGFPTESDAMFDSTLSLIEDCGLIFLHVFPFSPRPSTPAARMPQVERGTVKARARRLREAGEVALAQRLRSEVGVSRPILLETERMGRTPQFFPVRLAEELPAGTIVEARLTGSGNGALEGIALR
jgi:threonylcarbamoyladenosine tRNA methylthiotransferase MtaB